MKGDDHKVGLDTEGVKETGVAIKQMFKQTNDPHRNELREDLRKWTASPDPSVNYETASRAHHKGTATWCIEGDTLADWKTSGPLLWIHGKPGSGKSVLSSVIIRDIGSMSYAGSALMAYFYFDIKDTEKQDARALLSSFLIQLSDQSDQHNDVLLGLFSAHNDGSEQPTSDSLAGCLNNMLAIAGQVPIYLVVDALDECPNDLGTGIPTPREKVLELVEDLVKLRHPNLRLCITSRPEIDICTVLEPLASQKISLHDEDGQKQDIIDYVTAVVHSDKKMKRWRNDDKDMVIENLTMRVDGMFRWVYCQLEVLRHCVPQALRRVLQELPKTLDETYERILNQINVASREQAHRLLQCLAVASRPLRVEELAELLAFDLNMGTGSIPKLITGWRRENKEEAVLSACSSLVIVIFDNGSRVVQFSHFSVKEFLTSDRLARSTEEVSRFYISLEPSHAILAQACLGVLLYLDDHTDEDNVEDIPLYRYASQYWCRHSQFGNVELHIKDALDYFFDMDRPHFSAWVRLQGLDDLLTVFEDMFEEPNPFPLSAAPLYFAAEKGLRGLVERLLKKHPQQVNRFGGRRGTPLHASVLGGNIEVAQLLLEHGADINSRSMDNRTPLHITIGHSDAVMITRFLLEHGADANAQQDDLSTPLHLAVRNGSLAKVLILLEHGAIVDARNIEGKTPMWLLTEHDHLNKIDLAQLLIEHGADVNPRTENQWTPLHWSALKGRLEITKLLLDHGANANAENDQGETPLHLVLRGNHDSQGHGVVIARLLLERGADAHARDKDYTTPWLLARYRGRIDIARALLYHDAKAPTEND